MGLCLPPSLSEETLQGFKYFRLLGPLFDHLHRAATERDRAGNRQLFYDQYASLLLLQQFPLIPVLPLFSSTQNTLWAVDISIEVKSSLNHAQNGFDMRSGIRLVRALNARSLSRT